MLAHHINEVSQCPDVAKKLKDCFYVDDFITGVPDVDTALNFCMQSKMIPERAAMNLHKWDSNEPDLLLKLQDRTSSERTVSNSIKTLTKNDETYTKAINSNSVFKPCSGSTKILGVVWDSTKDVFLFDLTEISELASSEEIPKILWDL